MFNKLNLIILIGLKNRKFTKRESLHDNVFSEIDSLNKSIVEKVQLIEQLDEKQKESIFNIIDMALYNLKLKKTLSNALAL